MTLGRRIRELRVADPYMTQRELAARAFLTVTRLSKIEAGQVKPESGTITAIAVALQLRAGDLLDLIDLLDAWEPAPPFDISDASFVCGRRG